jgi:hypothetical protein
MNTEDPGQLSEVKIRKVVLHHLSNYLQNWSSVDVMHHLSNSVRGACKRLHLDLLFQIITILHEVAPAAGSTGERDDCCPSSELDLTIM